MSIIIDLDIELENKYLLGEITENEYKDKLKELFDEMKETIRIALNEEKTPD